MSPIVHLAMVHYGGYDLHDSELSHCLYRKSIAQLNRTSLPILMKWGPPISTKREWGEVVFFSVTPWKSQNCLTPTHDNIHMYIRIYIHHDHLHIAIVWIYTFSWSTTNHNSPFWKRWGVSIRQLSIVPFMCSKHSTVL